MFTKPQELPTIKALNKIDSKHRVVLFCGGMRGNALIRILAAHKESWWDSDLMNNGDTSTDPLLHPENTSGFYALDSDKLKEWFATAHTGCGILDEAIFKQLLKKRQNDSDKWWFTWTHPLNIDLASKSIQSEHITVYASEKSKYRKYFTTSPVKNNFAINVDISKLFSHDREKFYEEYIKIINHFGFTARFTSVRNFVLQLLDRESYISRFNKNPKFNWLIGEKIDKKYR